MSIDISKLTDEQIKAIETKTANMIKANERKAKRDSDTAGKAEALAHKATILELVYQASESDLGKAIATVAALPESQRKLVALPGLYLTNVQVSEALDIGDQAKVAGIMAALGYEQTRGQAPEGVKTRWTVRYTARPVTASGGGNAPKVETSKATSKAGSKAGSNVKADATMIGVSADAMLNGR